jgi:hypothetical protein
VAIEVMGLPPMTSIAAGHSHCLMTDGQRVWAMGSWLLSNGKKVCPIRQQTYDQCLHSSTWCSVFRDEHSILCPFCIESISGVQLRGRYVGHAQSCFDDCTGRNGVGHSTASG